MKGHGRRESLGHWISLLYRKRNIFFNRELRPLGLRAGEDRMLFGLHHLMVREGHQEVSQADVARFLGLDKGAVTRAMKKLESKGYVLRERSPRDAREYCLSLTEKALGAAAELRALRRKWTGALERGFSPEEKKTALSLLEKMAANADRSLTGEGVSGI